jgi:hypothetical protein
MVGLLSLLGTCRVRGTLRKSGREAVRRAGAYETTTVPFMPLWIVQKYVKVPGLS